MFAHAYKQIELTNENYQRTHVDQRELNLSLWGYDGKQKYALLIAREKLSIPDS